MPPNDGFVDVADFGLHSLRRVRITNEKFQSNGRLAVSSRFGIGVVLLPFGRVCSFNTADVHSLRASASNINDEVHDLCSKISTIFDATWSPSSLHCNCDGSFIAAVVNTSNGPTVYIFDIQAFSPTYSGSIAPITSVRVSAEAGAEASVLEWSPTSPDIFAVSATDRTLMTVQICFSELGKFTVMKEMKLGAVVYSISWSPKGKQLVVGDSCGKITQMKPELDIVRSTSAPPSCEFAKPCVVGLCWLSTTEFMAIYGDSEGTKIEATIMVTKKDQPVTWKSLSELNYVSSNSPLPLSIPCLPLLERNVVFLASTKCAELSVVGKESTAWQVWGLDDTCRADLPTDRDQRDTFPVGVALDFSAQHQIILSEDGEKRAPPSPIVFILTSDGVLLAFHAVTHKQLPSLQVTPERVNASSIKAGYPLTTVVSAPSVTAEPASDAGGGLEVASSANNMLASLATAPICSPNTSKPSLPIPVVPPSSTPTQNAQLTEQKMGETEEARRKREEVNEKMALLKQNWLGLEEETQRLQLFILSTARAIKQLEGCMDFGQREFLPEMSGILAMLKVDQEEVINGFQYTLESARTKLDLVSDENLIADLRDVYDFDKEQCMQKIKEQMSDLRAKRAAFDKELQQLEHLQSFRVGPSMISLNRETERKLETALERIRNRTQHESERCLHLERMLKGMQRQSKPRSQSGSGKAKEEGKTPRLAIPHSVNSDVYLTAADLETSNIIAQRRKLREKFAKQSLDLKKPSRPVPGESFSTATPSKGDFNVSLLESRLLEITSPRKPLQLPDLTKLSVRPVSVASVTPSSASSVPHPSTIRISAPKPALKGAGVMPTPLASSTPLPSKQPIAPAPSIASPAYVPKFGGGSNVNSSSSFTSAKALSQSEKTASSLVKSEGSIPVTATEKGKKSDFANSLFSTPVAAEGSEKVKTPDTDDATAFSTPVTAASKDNSENIKAPSTLDFFRPSATTSSSLASVTPSAPLSTAVASANSPSLFGVSSPSSAAGTTAATLPLSTEPEKTSETVITTTAAATVESSPVDSSISQPQKSSGLFGTAKTSSSIFGGVAGIGGSPASVPSSTPSIFGGATAKPAGSIFGGSPATTSTTSSSLFGQGGAATAGAGVSASFGGSLLSGGAPSPPSASSFSFKPAASSGTASNSPFNFNKPSVPAPGGFAAAAAAAAAAASAEDGMMEDEGAAGGSSAPSGSVSSIFAKSSGGFLSGLGSSSSSSTTPANVFGGGSSSWLWGGNPSGSSNAFGRSGGLSAVAAGLSSSSNFASSAQQAASTFTQPSSSLFGAAPQFGAKPAFGSAAPSQKPASTFGSAAFSSFAGKSSGFGLGGTAAPQSSTSIFGGGVTQQPSQPSNTSSIFGGSQAAKPSSFTAWR